MSHPRISLSSLGMPSCQFSSHPNFACMEQCRTEVIIKMSDVQHRDIPCLPPWLSPSQGTGNSQISEHDDQLLKRYIRLGCAGKGYSVVPVLTKQDSTKVRILTDEVLCPGGVLATVWGAWEDPASALQQGCHIVDHVRVDKRVRNSPASASWHWELAIRWLAEVYCSVSSGSSTGGPSGVP